MERPTEISQLVITGGLEEYREYSQREYPQQALTMKVVGKQLYTFVLNVIAHSPMIIPQNGQKGPLSGGITPCDGVGMDQRIW